MFPSRFGVPAVALALALGACGGDSGPDRADERTDPPEVRTEVSSAPDEDRCTRIVIDPGHNARPNPDTEPIGPGSSELKIKDGGGTSGAITGIPEHTVTFQVSRLLRDDLERRGYCVTMTRTRDDGLSMGNIARARIANRADAALFVRIHADGSLDPRRQGTSVLYPAYREEWTDDILPASKRAAELIQAELVPALGSRDLGIVERSDLTGFKWADVPAVLPELGFMTNAKEDRLLTSPGYQRKAAAAMARGVERFAPPQ